MDKYFTLMLIPEKESKVRSIRVPGIVMRSFAFLIVSLSLLIGVFVYDYLNILSQVYENKHLNIENRQLREQIQLFQMKINSIGEDIERINTFEKKLRIITGLEDVTTKGPLFPDSEEEMMDDYSQKKNKKLTPSTQKQTQVRLPLSQRFSFDNFEENPQYIELKELYEKKIASHLGLSKNFQLTRKWSDLTKKSFLLAGKYSQFDYKYKLIKNTVNELELKIHELDQYLLDKDSILKSTPTILPTNGWITSYYGQRISPYSKSLKMHEGIDVGAPPGSPILAPADGVVTFSGIKAGFGKFIQIDHGYGIETIYAHAKELISKSGEKVARGDLIAKVGSTGYSTGPHLHYEVRVNGIAVDPLYFVIGEQE